MDWQKGESQNGERSLNYRCSVSPSEEEKVFSSSKSPKSDDKPNKTLHPNSHCLFATLSLVIFHGQCGVGDFNGNVTKARKKTVKTEQEKLSEKHARIENERESSTTLSAHSLLEPVEKHPLMTLAGAIAIGVVTGYSYPSLSERRHSSSERANEPESLSESPHQSLWAKWTGAFDEELDWIKGFGLALFLNTAKDAATKILPDWEEPLGKVFTRLQKKVEPGMKQPNSTQTEA